MAGFAFCESFRRFTLLRPCALAIIAAMSRVYIVNAGGRSNAMERVHCKSEDEELQSLLANNFDLLPGIRLTPKIRAVGCWSSARCQSRIPPLVISAGALIFFL